MKKLRDVSEFLFFEKKKIYLHYKTIQKKNEIDLTNQISCNILLHHHLIIQSSVNHINHYLPSLFC
jgi:hypothetical protein